MYRLFIEKLDPRILLTTLTGQVWDDQDASRTFDETEAAFPGITVYIDTNHNARYDTGEPTDVTDNHGRYQFTNLPSATYDVRTLLPDGIGQVSPGRLGSLEHQFDIGLNYLSEITPSRARAFQIAADRWESIIVGDLPRVKTDIGYVDDIAIDISTIDIDGGAGTLAQAEPTRFRTGSLLPSRGVMEFDLADLNQLEADGKLIDIITHEMGHVLGFGTLWTAKGLLAGSGTSTPRFTGTQATAAYNQIFGESATGVPVEGTGGPGTTLSHWRETSLRIELMTGYSEFTGVVEPISRITIQQFADLGYTVNPSAADTWDPVLNTASAWQPADAGVRPFTRRVVLAGDNQTDINFAVRANRAPTVTSFSINPSQATIGETIRLQARAIDPNHEPVFGMTFYRESNGTPGLQSGSDTYVSTKFIAKQGAFAADTSTAGLTGSINYYAVAVDEMLFAGRREATAGIFAPTGPPIRPNPLIASRQTPSSVQLLWQDRSDNEIGFRIEFATESNFSHGSIVRSFNVPNDTVLSLVTGLTADDGYYFRIRSYNLAGVSAYTSTSRV